VVPEFLNVWRYRELIWFKAWADFRAAAARTYLSVVWWFLEPLLNMAGYYVVFGMIFAGRGPDFVPFLLIGLIAYRLFEGSVKHGSRAIAAARNLVAQVSFHKIVFVLSAVITQIMQMGCALLLVVISLIVYQIPLSPHMLAFPLVVFVEVLLILGVTLPLAAIVPLVPDITNAMDAGLRVVFYLSGVFFSAERLSGAMQSLFWTNPMAHMLHAQRQCLMYQEWPHWDSLALIAGVSCIGIVIGAAMIWRMDEVYAKRIVA